MKNNLIFFDIDGVLNSEDYTIGRHGLVGTPMAIERDDIVSYNIDINAVGILNCIVEETGAELVLFSDWRRSGDVEDNRDINEVLMDCGLKKPFTSVVPVIREGTRGEELEKWFEIHPNFDGDYVILSNDAIEWAPWDRSEHWIWINRKHGLTVDEAYRIINRFKKRIER